MSRVRRLSRRVGMAAVIAAAAAAAAPGGALADGPGTGSPWIVALGDSAISGEAGRWAGNTNDSLSRVDALGPNAYSDNASGHGEAIPGCHRSKAAEVAHRRRRQRHQPRLLGRADYTRPISTAARSSRASTSTATRPAARARRSRCSEFARDPQRQRRRRADRRQRLRLRRHRADVRRRLADLAVVVEELLPGRLNIRAMFTAAQHRRRRPRSVKQALPATSRQAMHDAGYSPSHVHDLRPDATRRRSPTAPASATPQTGFTRQTIGGCGVWNARRRLGQRTRRADPQLHDGERRAQPGLSNVEALDTSAALVGHRLCENTVGLLEERGIATGSSPGAADGTEWV